MPDKNEKKAHPEWLFTQTADGHLVPVVLESRPYRDQDAKTKARWREAIANLVDDAIEVQARLDSLKKEDPDLYVELNTLLSTCVPAYIADAISSEELQRRIEAVFAAQEQKE